MMTGSGQDTYIMTCPGPGYLRDPEPPLQQRQAQKQQEVAQSEPRIALSRGRDTGAAPPRGGYSIAIIFGCESSLISRNVRSSVSPLVSKKGLKRTSKAK